MSSDGLVLQRAIVRTTFNRVIDIDNQLDNDGGEGNRPEQENGGHNHISSDQALVRDSAPSIRGG